MSDFKKLIVSFDHIDKEGRRFYKLDRPFSYTLGRKGSGISVNVPVDFESIPKPFLKLIKKRLKYQAAFVIRDISWLFLEC